jgi:hypothetical protein
MSILRWALQDSNLRLRFKPRRHSPNADTGKPIPESQFYFALGVCMEFVDGRAPDGRAEESADALPAAA